VTRKIEYPARVRALGMEGEPEPSLARFSADRMVELAGPDRDRAAEEGARRRIRKGANREPLT
jgi:hypothetical protein